MRNIKRTTWCYWTEKRTTTTTTNILNILMSGKKTKNSGPMYIVVPAPTWKKFI
jgi:hypothetical protein